MRGGVIHLKMTSERSKRRDFLALVFISKSISKKLLINKDVYLSIRQRPHIAGEIRKRNFIFTVSPASPIRHVCSNAGFSFSCFRDVLKRELFENDGVR